MAWSWCINIEAAALELARSSISKMTNSNYDASVDLGKGVRLPDDEAFRKNLKHGFIAAVMGTCFYEASLNSLLRKCFDFDPEGEVIKGGEGLKLEVLFSKNPQALAKIKSKSCWRDAHRLFRMRNELVHYKNNSSGPNSAFPPIGDWMVGKEIVGDFFVKNEMESCLDDVEKLVALYADFLGMAVNPSSDLLAGGGRFPTGDYFCTVSQLKEIDKELAGGC
ncbi:MAG: hypothetical protein HFJ66_01495 [Eggerthellaceae bacterium]|nr:hypothetical protein [Eggerthellaceae bacterium]